MKAVIIILLAYLPVRLLLYAFSAQVKKKLLIVLVVLGGTFYCGVLIKLLDLSVVYAVAFVGLFTIAAVDGLFGWIRLLYKKVIDSQRQLKAAAKQDQTWDEERLKNLYNQTIVQYIHDLDNKAIKKIRGYATQQFAYGSELYCNALNEHGLTTTTDSLVIDSAKIVDVHDVIDNEQDRFTVLVEGSKHVKVVDKNKDSKDIDSGVFTELWHFDRENGEWRLDGIETAERAEQTTKAARVFEHTDGFFSKKEWGSVFIPHLGVLAETIKTNKLTVDDFRIGIRHNLLIDFLSLSGEKEAGFAVCSLHVNRDVPHIVVRHRSVENLPVAKLKLIEVDWPKFTEKYEVFTESTSSKAATQMLQQKLMDDLCNLSFAVNIEVIGGRIYAFTQDPSFDINMLMDTIIMIEDTLWVQ